MQRFEVLCGGGLSCLVYQNLLVFAIKSLGAVFSQKMVLMALMNGTEKSV